jgi:anaerobic magnesium-protoporphyrin IX monomethyl ester cyclase
MEHGFECDILDLSTCIPSKREEYFLKRVKNYDFVGLSFLTPGYYEAMKLANLAKEANPQIKVIFGGSHATFEYESALKNPAVDFVIIGEGEISLVELLSGKDKRKINGLAYRKGKKILMNQPVSIKNLDDLPDPAREKFKPIHFKYMPLSYVEVSRGCTNRCSFCTVQNFYKTIRFRDPKKVVNEIEKVSSEGIKTFYLLCANFTASNIYAEKLLKEIRDRKLNHLRFMTTAAVETTTKDFLKLYKMSGGDYISFGIESLEPRSLNYINKTRNPKAYFRRAVALMACCKKIHLKLRANLIVGIPHQKIENIVRDILIVKKFGEANIHVLTPFPGTLEQERLKDRIIEKDISKFDSDHLVFDHPLTEEQLEKIRRLARSPLKEMGIFLSTNYL